MYFTYWEVFIHLPFSFADSRTLCWAIVTERMSLFVCSSVSGECHSMMRVKKVQWIREIVFRN